MNERHIRRIRSRFIMLSTLSLFGVMLLLSGLIYFFNQTAMQNELHQIMNVIAENDGLIPGSSGESTLEIYEAENDQPVGLGFCLSFLLIPFSVSNNLSLVVTIFISGSFCFFDPVLDHD